MFCIVLAASKHPLRKAFFGNFRVSLASNEVGRNCGSPVSSPLSGEGMGAGELAVSVILSFSRN
jgi:hypothetical protein